MASTSKNQRALQPVHRPHSPKNPPSSVFSTIDLDETDSDSPIVPKRLRKRTVPKIVESVFGRNEQFSSSQIRADSSPGFDLLVERRAARKAEASRQVETRRTGDDMNWEELQELRPNTPEPGPSSPSTSKRGSVEPRGSSPLDPNNDPPTPQPRPGPQPLNTIDAAERKMIEAREELSKVALRFRTRLPRSPVGSKSPNTRTNGNGDEMHPFDESTHPFDETTHSFDETTHPFDDSHQSQELHPFEEDSHIPSQEAHPFDEETQPLDGIIGSQRSELGPSGIRMGISPVPPTPGGFKRRTETFLPTSLLENRNGRHSRNPSDPPPLSPLGRLRPGLSGSPNYSPRSPRSPTTDSPLRRLGVPTPTTSMNPLRSPRPSTEDGPSLSPQKARTRVISPGDGRPKPKTTQELRELLESSPRARRASANAEVQPNTHGEMGSALRRILLTSTAVVKLPKTSDRKQPTHKTRFSEPSGTTTKLPVPRILNMYF